MSSLMLVGLLIFAAFSVSLVMTFSLRFYAMKHLMDIPNQRSSHQIPTPSGGGLGIVLAFLTAIVVLFIVDSMGLELFLVLLTSLMIAGIGFWDDHRHIPARWRFSVQVLAALIIAFCLQGFPPLSLGSYRIDLGFSGYFIAVLFLVWMLNLFNFMDGIDGIAASEAIFVSASLAGFVYTKDTNLALPAIALAFSCLGFLIWNWPPAKIFMGDVGSGFLGFLLAVLILVYSFEDPVFLYVGLILFAVFVVDSTYTLLCRFIAGEKWYEAHCSHAYQHLARKHGHLKVTLSVWAINICWLLPLALLVFRFSDYAWAGLLMAYSPLIVAASRFEAGSG